MDDLIERARKEGAVNSLSMPDDWANWEATWKAITAQYGIKHTDTDPNLANALAVLLVLALLLPILVDQLFLRLLRYLLSANGTELKVDAEPLQRRGPASRRRRAAPPPPQPSPRGRLTRPCPVSAGSVPAC